VVLWIEVINAWLQFFFALGSFIANCFAEKYIAPETKLDERV
jgi:hypothetical protein